jgi:hypothetical protein
MAGPKPGLDSTPKTGPKEAREATAGLDTASCRSMRLFPRQDARSLHEGYPLGDRAWGQQHTTKLQPVGQPRGIIWNPITVKTGCLSGSRSLQSNASQDLGD